MEPKLTHCKMWTLFSCTPGLLAFQNEGDHLAVHIRLGNPSKNLLVNSPSLKARWQCEELDSLGPSLFAFLSRKNDPLDHLGWCFEKHQGLSHKRC
jgi:hypothetical protein